jgi:hypothetical protein
MVALGIACLSMREQADLITKNWRTRSILSIPGKPLPVVWRENASGRFDVPS